MFLIESSSTVLDYSSIAALSAVIETQGFQSAADKLFITQSAVSQRIKSLENYYGEPVLIRSLPYQPTKLGLMLIGHYKRVTILEDSLQETISLQNHVPTISIAISRDSLETWFVDVIKKLKILPFIQLEIIADDQELTLEYLQKGLVSACASTTEKQISGCECMFMGYFNYVFVSSPDFKKKYFSKNKSNEDNLINAPGVIFDNNDKLHNDYLKHYFNINNSNIKYHTVPSVKGFRLFAENGYACALIPELDILSELAQKKLVKIFPDKPWKMPMYWHHWSIENIIHHKFNELVCRIGRKLLHQK